MPSQARRVQLTVYDKDLDLVLDNVARLQGIPKTKVIMNILLEMKPVLVDFVAALEMVHAKKDPTSILMGMTSRLLGDLSQEVSSYNKFRDSALVSDEKVGQTGEQALPRQSPTQSTVTCNKNEEQLGIFLDEKDAHHAND